MNVYNIPTGVSFSRALAAALLKKCAEDPHILPQYRILLPTRRACRTLREAFLKLNDGAPIMLPRMQPLGDVDDEELSLNLSPDEAGALADLPPAIPALRRRILLSRLIMAAEGFAHGSAHAVALADALARLIDRIHTENLRMEDLPKLAPEDFAAHWQITLKFLSVISHEWPKLLHSMNAIDAAQRRNLLMNTLATHWENHPPATPIIAAGSTGSIPATARLLKTISQLPQGAVILPGLDQIMDDESWGALDDTHPQATLRHLLNELGIDRSAVDVWPHDAKPDNARLWLASEIMRPAATAGAWAQIAPDKKTLANRQECIICADCETIQEEAQLIAALMRRTLETPTATAALITPDRSLARRVAAACRRWNIAVDDSAGTKLQDTDRGIFLRLVMRAFLDRFAPGSLLSLLRHRLCSLDENLDQFEIHALRGAKPPPGIDGLRNRIGDSKIKGDKNVLALLDTLENAFAPLTALPDTAPFANFLDTHIATCENLSGGADALWIDADGEAVAAFFAELRGYAADMPDIGAGDYLASLEQLMSATPPVRPQINAHPRLFILGQLEARLFDADLIVMGSLNEGTWPPDSGHDPFLSRPMMKQFGLPPPERSIGLAAHDFVQGFCAPQVALTRARRIDGAPTVPARWLQRLNTVLRACDVDPGILHSETNALRSALRALDENKTQKSTERPRPVPPVSLRPRQLSVTKIETWMRDPYNIYAKHILKLKKLDPLEKPPDAAERGTFLHEALHRFITTCHNDIPGNARAILLDTGRDLLSRRADDPGYWDFWWPRFERIAEWIVENEKEWRHTAQPLKTEIDGTMELTTPAGPFILTARADRIDTLRAGGYALIDYKSGGNYSGSKIASGESPQLPLEGLIVAAGGFANIPAGAPKLFSYWILSGGEVTGKRIEMAKNAELILEAAHTGLKNLITAFDDPATPYYSLPDPDRPLRFNDFEQLARVQEWAALGEEGEEAA